MIDSLTAIALKMKQTKFGRDLPGRVRAPEHRDSQGDRAVPESEEEQVPTGSAIRSRSKKCAFAYDSDAGKHRHVHQAGRVAFCNFGFGGKRIRMRPPLSAFGDHRLYLDPVSIQIADDFDALAGKGLKSVHAAIKKVGRLRIHEGELCSSMDAYPNASRR